MAYQQWIVRPLQSSSGLAAKSHVLDLGHAQDVRAVLTAMSMDSATSLSVRPRHSADALSWEELEALRLFGTGSVVRALLSPAGTHLSRYLQFTYEFTGSTQPPPTFSLLVVANDRSEAPGPTTPPPSPRRRDES